MPCGHPGATLIRTHLIAGVTSTAMRGARGRYVVGVAGQPGLLKAISSGSASPEAAMTKAVYKIIERGWDRSTAYGVYSGSATQDAAEAVKARGASSLATCGIVWEDASGRMAFFRPSSRSKAEAASSRRFENSVLRIQVFVRGRSSPAEIGLIPSRPRSAGLTTSRRPGIDRSTQRAAGRALLFKQIDHQHRDNLGHQGEVIRHAGRLSALAGSTMDQSADGMASMDRSHR